MHDSTTPPIGASWTGAGDHAGHTVTIIERWPVRIENATVEFRDGKVSHVRNGLITAGRLRCTCAVEWSFAGGEAHEGVRMPQPSGDFA